MAAHTTKVVPIAEVVHAARFFRQERRPVTIGGAIATSFLGATQRDVIAVPSRAGNARNKVVIGAFDVAVFFAEFTSPVGVGMRWGSGGVLAAQSHIIAVATAALEPSDEGIRLVTFLGRPTIRDPSSPIVGVGSTQGTEQNQNNNVEKLHGGVQ